MAALPLLLKCPGKVCNLQIPDQDSPIYKVKRLHYKDLAYFVLQFGPWGTNEGMNPSLGFTALLQIQVYTIYLHNILFNSITCVYYY